MRTKKTNLEENERIYLQMKIHFNYIKCGFEVNRLGRKLGSFKMEIKKMIE
jgi:hypothetical protein